MAMTTLRMEEEKERKARVLSFDYLHEALFSSISVLVHFAAVYVKFDLR